MWPLIAGVVMAIASAAIQSKNQSDAAKRADRATRDSLARQRQFQIEAEQAALSRAQQFNPEPREQRQASIEADLQAQYEAPALSAQAINENTATTQGNVSDDYLGAKALSDANQQKMAREYARLFAKIGSAENLRMLEGFDMADTASKLNQLQSFSQGQNAADQMKIQEAGQPNAGMGLLSGVLGAAGSAMMANGLTSGLNPATTGIGAGSTGIGGGSFGVGIKLPTVVTPTGLSW
ncbi:MAG: hypothetical protein LBK01_06815 [Burkholderiaceae bacterium]|jgi:hypothetical protein|nr:hypothetical protein [Burkholderiaceae bacterium]